MHQVGCETCSCEEKFGPIVMEKREETEAYNENELPNESFL